MALIVYINVPGYGLGDINFAHKLSELLQRRYGSSHEIIKIYQCLRRSERAAVLEAMGFIEKQRWIDGRRDDVAIDMVFEGPIYGQESIDWLMPKRRTKPPHLMLSEYDWQQSCGDCVSKHFTPVKVTTGFAKESLGVLRSLPDVAEYKVDDTANSAVGLSYCKTHVGRLRYFINLCYRQRALEQKVCVHLAFGKRSSVPNCIEYLGDFFKRLDIRTLEFNEKDLGFDQNVSFERMVEIIQAVQREHSAHDHRTHITILMPSLPPEVYRRISEYAGSLVAKTGDQSFVEALELGKVVSYELYTQTVGMELLSHKAAFHKNYMARMREMLTDGAYELLYQLNLPDDKVLESVSNDAIIPLLADRRLMQEISFANRALVVGCDMAAKLFNRVDRLLVDLSPRAVPLGNRYAISFGGGAGGGSVEPIESSEALFAMSGITVRI